MKLQQSGSNKFYLLSVLSSFWYICEICKTSHILQFVRSIYLTGKLTDFYCITIVFCFLIWSTFCSLIFEASIYHSNSSRNFMILLSHVSSSKLAFWSKTLWTFGTTNDEGIDEAPNSANISLSCCAAFTPPNIPGE